ncbi:hypothetical protein F4820DRAFT_259723 [Hypoxylon rubiginosum]|uniref:Uncharacterized protein n=1 Tax=Hypoxylon rubiginosum TaxID=110542 RepID=A0ACB9Z3K9_9PEZI|nr:hypothetical protein F4820DRAFT_259723 [Hypoxylon rubiginosum]
MGENEDDGVVQSYQAEPGSQLTGFYAKIMPSFGYFQYFSARSQVVGNLQQYPLSESPSVPHDIPITPSILTSAQEILSYRQGFAFTAANLSNLKRVRVSNKRAKIGLVRRLRLGAVFGATKAFLEPYISGMICLQYRESRYEKLSGILWGCNHEWDHVRIFHTPKLTDRASTLLVDSGTYSPPSWMVIQKVFAQGGLDDGCTTPLSSIEVTFKEMTSEVSGVTMIYEDGSSSTLGVRGEPRIIYLASGEKPAQVEIVAARDN